MINSTSVCVCVLAVSSFSSAPAQTSREVLAPASPVTEDRDLAAVSINAHGSTNLNEYRGTATAASGATFSTPQELSECLNKRELTELARRFVDAKLETWRNHLNLQHWQISIVMAQRSDLKPRTRGKIQWDKDKKSAVIWVMDASEYQLPLQEMLDDMEFTIVHELVHLELASLPRSEASRSTEEHTVNRITTALLRLARQQQL